MSAFSVGHRRRERGSADEHTDTDRDLDRDRLQKRDRSRSSSHSLSLPFSTSSRSRSVDSSASSFLSRFRRSSVSTAGSDGPTTPTEPLIPVPPPVNAKKQANRRRARTLETIPQNAATTHSRPPRSLRPHRHSHSATRLNSEGSHGSSTSLPHRLSSSRNSVFSFQRRNVQDLSRSRVTFEEPDHPLHETDSTTSLRSRPVSPSNDSFPNLPPPSVRLITPDLPPQSYRPRSLMSSLSESDIHVSTTDDENRHSISGLMSPASDTMSSGYRSPTRPLSPTPSSSSSSSNQKSFAKLRKKVASAFFNHSPAFRSSASSPTKETPSITFPVQSASDLHINVPDLRHRSSGTSTPIASPGSPPYLARSLSNVSHSSRLSNTSANMSPTSSVQRTRARSQTLNSLDNDRRASVRRDLPQLSQITGLANLFSLKLRTGSEPNFAELKAKPQLASSTSIATSTPSPTGPSSSPKHGNSPLPLALLDITLPDHEDENESPAEYLERVDRLISRNYIALLLSKDDSSFHKKVLDVFCARFDFTDEPIDMALRKFLLVVQLPKETQQIDRVLDAFAERYHYCNPEIFFSKDQAYVIAFSLMILHTDAFNKSNRHKMQKSDYVRNTQTEGISKDILECFYDNITYTPFVHMEEEIDLGTPASEKTLERPPLQRHRKSLVGLAKQSREPIDPYSYIVENRLSELRPPVSDVLRSTENPYSYSGTAPQFNVKVLHSLFINSPLLQILPPRSRQSSIMMEPSIPREPSLSYIKIAKIGILTSIERKRRRMIKSSWRSWGVFLTLSHIYFFRDVNWVRGLMDQLSASVSADEKNGQQYPFVFYPPIQGFHADEVMLTNDTITLLDGGYQKHRSSFVIVSEEGEEDWFMADSPDEMNDWIIKINYASALSTSGAKLQGVELKENGDPLMRHLVGSLRPGTRSNPSSPIIGSFPSPKRATPQPNTLTESERASALFSSLFYDDGTVKNRLSDASVLSSITEDHSTIAFALEVSRGRYRVLGEKVNDLQEELYRLTQILDEDSRTAKHLSILTPILPRTREALIAAVGYMSSKIDMSQINAMRVRCYREILVKEMDSERVVIELLEYKLQALTSEKQSSAIEVLADGDCAQHYSSATDPEKLAVVASENDEGVANGDYESTTFGRAM
ncbi:hypothetical protein BZA70DRAFT_273808 [Myxozyma melibiosi]|uniref:SEC7 domain-containing protein n=1 Tax=Myxozyma melibiosi TaxID=54550 RepID=A0ABR1FF44_9ASCO